MKRRGNTITSPDEIADALAGQYANISGDPYKNISQEDSARRKKKKTYQILNHLQTTK